MLFMLCGAVEALSLTAGFVLPRATYFCEVDGCVRRLSVVELAPEDQQAALWASPAALAVFARHVARPDVRLGLAAAAAIESAPLVVLMIAVGLALRRLAARTGQDLAGALPWLRRAAAAALGMAVAKPIADSLLMSILSRATPAGGDWRIKIDAAPLSVDLLLALAALAVAWALDAGSRAERDVAAFV